MNSAIKFFESKSIPEPNSGCWFWLGALDKDGYGRIRVADQKIAAHRVSYEALVAPIPVGLTLDHKCRVRCCVNPAHLEPVTNKVNVLRGMGPTAKHASKTHCIQGHPLSGDNLFWSQGARRCRICRRAINRKAQGYSPVANGDAPQGSNPP